MITALIVLLWIAFAYAIAVGVGFVWKPDLPTVLVGYIFGQPRAVNDRGGEVYWMDRATTFVLMFKPHRIFPDEENYYVTHIQYRSRFGFLLMWPFIFHAWVQLRYQRTAPNPNAANDPSHPTLRVPGSELCFYLRLPGWRKQSPGYVLSGGYPPFGHWD